MEELKRAEVVAVDLFCGAGGFSRGMLDAGIIVRGGYDTDNDCFFPYAYNNALMRERDVRDVAGAEVKRDFLNYRGKAFSMIFGSPPCQAFSSLNAKTRGVNTENDPRAKLPLEFVRIVEEVKPDFVALENVPNIVKNPVFAEILKRLEKRGYKTRAQVVDAASYGVPQRRKRLILLASRLGEIELITPEEFGATPRTVRDAIGDLEPIQAGETSPRDPLHKAGRLSELNLRRLRALEPGASRRALPDELKLACQKRPNGDRYASANARMEYDKVAPTISTEFHILGTGRFGHPEQDRALSLREGARLQTFPDEYKFVPNDAPIRLGRTARLIGNAVPPTLAKAIGLSILKHAEKWLKN